MATRTGRGVRGARPPALRLDDGEQAAFERLDAELTEQSGLVLHPLLRCIPLPKPEKEYAKVILDRFAAEGWTAPVLVVRFGQTRRILTDAFALKLWLDSGRKLAEILPPNIYRASDAVVLAWYLHNHVPRSWKKWRRALAAAALAGACHNHLHGMAALLGLEPMAASVKNVLARLVGVSPRHLQYALLQLRRSDDRFRRALWGTAKVFSVKRIAPAVPRGSGARKDKLELHKFGNPRLPAQFHASLAIIDLELVNWKACRPKDIVNFLVPPGYVVLLADSAPASGNQYIQNLNQALGASLPPYEKLAQFKCVVKVKQAKAGEKKPDVSYREALVLWRDLSSNPQWDEAKKMQYRNYRETMKEKCDLEKPEKFVHNLDRRQARIRVYKQLMSLYAYPKEIPVFAPCFDGSTTSAHRKFLSCFKSAGHRAKRSLLCYE